MAAKRRIGFWGVTAIGIGGMVGGGIFAVLGLAVALAQGGTPLAFLVAGTVALLTSYSYAKLSVRFPSQGGTVTFVDRVFGVDLFTGSMNVLLWISYVVMLALYAYAFGSYGAALLSAGDSAVVRHLLITAAIVAPAALNVLNAEVIGRAETYIVAVKLLILLFFVAIGFRDIDPARVEPSSWAPALPLLAGGMVIFLAYEGFELIANSAEDVRAPEKTIPRAFYTAVAAVIVLYVLVALVTVGNLSVAKIAEAQDYALAEAARPFLGNAGFILIAIAALLSTLSAINATLYGSARLCYSIAKDRELPEFLEKKVWDRPLEGLAITALLALLLANLGDLSSISMMGSAGFLLVFAAVNVANVVAARETKSIPWLSAVGAATCILALGALVWHVQRSSPARLFVLAGMIALAVVVESGYRLTSRRSLRLQ